MTLMDNISVIHSDMKPDDRQLIKWLPDAYMTTYMGCVINILNLCLFVKSHVLYRKVKRFLDFFCVCIFHESKDRERICRNISPKTDEAFDEYYAGTCSTKIYRTIKMLFS